MKRFWIVVTAAGALGCSTSGSGTLILFPEPYRLLPETKALKAAHPQPIAWPRELGKGVTPPAVAEPGDVVAVSPADQNQRAFVGEQPVLLDGSIDLGPYGRVQVAYMDCAQIEVAVEAAVAAKEKKAVDMTVHFARAPASKVVYVLGEVTTPGSYALEGRETTLDAILLAGGLTRKADVNGIVLSRPTGPCDCRVVVPICYEEIVQWGDSSTNYQIRPGDRIYVPTLSLWQRLFGPKYGKRCPPCGRCPAPCPLPPENCCFGPAMSEGPASGMLEHAVPAPAAKPTEKPAEKPKVDPPKPTNQAAAPARLPEGFAAQGWRPLGGPSAVMRPAVESRRPTPGEPILPQQTP